MTSTTKTTLPTKAESGHVPKLRHTALGLSFVAAGVVANGCMSGEPHPCLAAKSAALYYGTDRDDRLEPDRKALAIGALERENGSVECTATVVARGLVLTARHCRGALAVFRTGSDDTGQVSARAGSEHPHPDRDILLVELEPDPDFDSLDIHAIPLIDETITDSWLGTEATLSGLGETETRDSGERRFLREPIVRVTEDAILVDGQGMSGACTGDSGGPLLKEDLDGVWRLIGVLAKGSDDCLGRDLYERVDRIRPWLEASIADLGREPSGCEP